jgi:hypothetical protein
MIKFLFKTSLNTDAHPEFRTNGVLHFDFLEKGRGVRDTRSVAWPVRQKGEDKIRLALTLQNSRCRGKVLKRGKGRFLPSIEGSHLRPV